MKIAKTAGVITILNPAPATKLPIGMLELCDFVTPNEIETESLTGIKVETDADAERAAASLHEMGVKTPVITLGERGAFLYGHGLVPSFQVGQVVETTGAGDAFNGGLAAGLSGGHRPGEPRREPGLHRWQLVLVKGTTQQPTVVQLTVVQPTVDP